MVGIGIAGCDGCGCDEEGEPIPICDESCCESYASKMRIWAVWNPSLAIPGLTCDTCSGTPLNPFEIVLTKDETPGYFSWYNDDLDCSPSAFSGCYAAMATTFDRCFETVCMSATYSGNASTGCQECTPNDPELGPLPPFATRTDYYFWAGYVKGNGEIVLALDDITACTIYLEILEHTYIGPDCDNLEFCRFNLTGYMVTNNTGGACSCGAYDIVPTGGVRGGCACASNSIFFPSICDFSFFPVPILVPNTNKLEVVC